MERSQPSMDAAVSTGGQPRHQGECAHGMLALRPTMVAQMMLREMIRVGDTVIDATAGQGHDTVFLAECVGEAGRVLALDTQEAAIRASRAVVESAGFVSRVEFHQMSHAQMGELAAESSIAAVMFNLGYLPGGDHAVITEVPETLAALEAAARLLQPGGILSVVCYQGHVGGAEESAAVESWMTQQTAKGWKVAKYAMLGTLRPAPFLLLAWKG